MKPRAGHGSRRATRNAEARRRLEEDRIRILHVFAPAPYGGLEEVVKALAVRQASADHTVAVLAVLDQDVPDHPIVDHLRDRGNVDVYDLRVPPRAYRRERALGRDVLDRFGPEVVHTHGYRADVLHSGVARGLGIASVATVHGFIGGGLKNRLYEWLQRQAYRRYDAVVAVSRSLQEELISDGIPKGRIHCIPNAWVGEIEFLDRAEAGRRLGIDSGGRWVGFVGRLGREKGADVFVDGIARVRRPSTGVMIGDGRLRGELVERAEARGITERIRFLGVVPSAGRYMRALDVFVLSSRTEGTPIALLEAIAAGVPVVATRVGGVPDVVSDREAILVEPERPAELAAAIDSVLADPDAAGERARRARQVLEERLGAEPWVEAYDRVYRRVVSSASGGG